MEHKQVIAIFAITLIFFIGVFLRPSYRAYPGMDAYYFRNYISSDKSEALEETPIFGNAIFNILPDNDFLIKLVMFLVTLGCVYLFGLIGEYYVPKYGWMAGLFLLTGVIFHHIFIRLEDDLFGFFLVLVSWYILVNYHRVNDKHFIKKTALNLLSLLVLALAVFTWKWAIYFLILFAFLFKDNKLYLMSAGISIIIFFNQILGGIMPSLLVSENAPLIGILTLLIMMLGYAKSARLKQNNAALLFATILTLGNAKFVFLLVPILCLNLCQYVKAMPRDKSQILLIVSAIMLLYIAYSNFTAMPSEENYDLYNKYIKTSNDLNLPKYNNWSYGYYLEYLGIKTNSKKSAYDNIIEYSNTIIYTIPEDQNIKKYGCKILLASKAGIIAKC